MVVWVDINGADVALPRCRVCSLHRHINMPFRKDWPLVKKKKKQPSENNEYQERIYDDMVTWKRVLQCWPRGRRADLSLVLSVLLAWESCVALTFELPLISKFLPLIWRHLISNATLCIRYIIYLCNIIIVTKLPGIDMPDINFCWTVYLSFKVCWRASVIAASYKGHTIAAMHGMDTFTSQQPTNSIQYN